MLVLPATGVASQSPLQSKDKMTENVDRDRTPFTHLIQNSLRTVFMAGQAATAPEDDTRHDSKNPQIISGFGGQ